MKNCSFFIRYRKNFSVFAFLAALCLAFAGGSGIIISVDVAAAGKPDDVHVSAFAGDGTAGFADGPGASARFHIPNSVAVDAAGNVYVADSQNNRIRKIDKAGNVSTLAGGTKGFADGAGTSARFNSPWGGIAVDGAGNIYMADQDNHRIRKIDRAGNVNTLAGSGTKGFADGAGTSARFNTPWGIVVDGTGNVYVADNGNSRIRKIDKAGNVSTLAGDGTAGYADGPGASAKFNGPCGLAIDKAGIIYVVDFSNFRIRKIDKAGNVSTLAGDGTQGFADGPGTLAKFNVPFDITIDGAGNAYVADFSNLRIRKIDRAGNVSTLAAMSGLPMGVAADGAGNVYVADMNHRIIRITYGRAGGAEEASKVRLGELIGTVGGFEGSDVIVNGKDTIGVQAPIGRALIVDANGQYIYLQSIFPMQTVVKCKITGGDRAQVKKGMKVYLKP